MKIRAHAKINLGLNVVGKREDGYHELEMIMVPISLHDLLYINIIDDGIEIISNSSIMPLNEKNIMYKVAKAMMDRYHIQKGIRIHIYKHIPMQAGLAGGSADGAAVMRAINILFKLGLSYEELAELGKTIGADIPFCIYEKPAFVSGIGEKLEFIENNIKKYIVLVKPKKGVSTKRSFGMLEIEKEEHPDCRSLKDAIIENDYDTMLESMGNTLEGVSMKLVPQIGEIKKTLEDMGFDIALMSGSGSCVFALTEDENLVDEAVNHFRKQKMFAQRATFL